MGYGVKVAQQILILFVKVRILVTQQKRADKPALFYLLLTYILRIIIFLVSIRLRANQFNYPAPPNETIFYTFSPVQQFFCI